MKRSPIVRKTPMRRTPKRKPPRVPKVGPRPDPDGRFWHGQRRTLFERSGWRCERCGTDLRVTGMEAHHRKLRSQGGPDDLWNLTALCQPCHTGSEGVHSHSIVARSQGFIVPASQDPRSWAMVLWDGRTVRLLEDGSYDVVFQATVKKTS